MTLKSVVILEMTCRSSGNGFIRVTLVFQNLDTSHWWLPNPVPATFCSASLFVSFGPHIQLFLTLLVATQFLGISENWVFKENSWVMGKNLIRFFLVFFAPVFSEKTSKNPAITRLGWIWSQPLVLPGLMPFLQWKIPRWLSCDRLLTEITFKCLENTLLIILLIK